MAIIKMQFNKRAIKTSTAEGGVMQLMHLALGCEFTLNGDVQPMLSRALQAITLPRCHFIIWNSCTSDWMAPRPQSCIFPVVWGILGCVAELLLETACVKGMNWRVQIVSVMEDGLRLCLCYNSLFLRPLWIVFTSFLQFRYWTGSRVVFLYLISVSFFLEVYCEWPDVPRWLLHWWGEIRLFFLLKPFCFCFYTCTDKPGP